MVNFMVHLNLGPRIGRLFDCSPAHVFARIERFSSVVKNRIYMMVEVIFFIALRWRNVS